MVSPKNGNLMTGPVAALLALRICQPGSIDFYGISIGHNQAQNTTYPYHYYDTVKPAAFDDIPHAAHGFYFLVHNKLPGCFRVREKNIKIVCTHFV
mmetsp:Transcript_1679/g.2212  ORF Transcript_1679/g.2212 Transcript_1679/m.2212 type:complete len:96 (+) Transcript_1679:490-777(+)